MYLKHMVNLANDLQSLILTSSGSQILMEITKKVIEWSDAIGSIIVFYSEDNNEQSGFVHMALGTLSENVKKGTPISKEDLIIKSIKHRNISETPIITPLLIQNYSMKMNSIKQLKESQINEAMVIPIVNSKNQFSGYFAFFYSYEQDKAKKSILNEKEWLNISYLFSIAYQQYELSRLMKKMEEQKEQAESINKVFITKTSSYIIRLNITGSIKSVNPLFENLLRIKEKDLIGKSIPTSKEEIEKLEPLFLEACKGHNINKVRVMMFNANKEEIYFEADLVPIINSENKVVEVIFFGDNITDFIRMESEIKEKDAEIQSYQQELTEVKHTIETIHDELEFSKKMNMVIKITSKLNNIFNNSIQAILNYFEAFEDFFLEHPNVENQKVLLSFARQSKKLTKNITTIIKQMNEIEFYSKVKKKIETSINLYESLKKIMKYFENYTLSKGISFAYHFEFSELKTRLIHSREIDLERSFKIVIENAILACYNKEAYEKGSPKIAVSFKEQKIQDRIWLFISVIDNGIGIKKEHIAEIFEPFTSYWDKKDFNPEEPNIGVGLFKLRVILKNYDGKIQIKTKLNEGTTFIFQIPI